jgi:hypothetical protein
MREHVPFKDFSNGFIWANKPDCLLQMEATTLKMREVERLNDTEDRLANNNFPTIISEGERGLGLQMAEPPPPAVLHWPRLLAAKQ